MKQLTFHPHIGTVDISNPKYISLVLENPHSYWTFCRYLYDGFPEHLGYCTISSEDEDIDMETYGLFISNPLDLTLNTKPNLNALYKILKKSYFEELSAGVEQIEKELERICKEIKLDFDAELVMDGSLRIDDVFKLGGLQFCESDSGFLDQLTRYVSVSSELRKIGIVFVCNIRDYLMEDELESFLKELFYRGISLIDIKTKDDQLGSDDVTRFIVDQDLCTIS